MKLLLSLLLSGLISNQHGYIGVTVSKYGHIHHVYRFSPAALADLRVGDIILSSDGVKGIKEVDGLAGTIAHLRVKRKDQEFYLEVKRIPKVSD